MPLRLGSQWKWPMLLRVGLIGSRSFGKAVAEMIDSSDHSELIDVWHPGGTDALSEYRGAYSSESAFFQTMRDARANVVILAHATQWIKPEHLDCADLGILGWHPSLLPRHRGRDAVRWTVHMGDPIAGGTIYRLDGGVDTGPIVKQDWCHVAPGETASSLWADKLFPMGIRLYDEVLGQAHKTMWLPSDWQDERYATWEPSWDREPLSGNTGSR